MVKRRRPNPKLLKKKNRHKKDEAKEDLATSPVVVAAAAAGLKAAARDATTERARDADKNRENKARADRTRVTREARTRLNRVRGVTIRLVEVIVDSKARHVASKAGLAQENLPGRVKTSPTASPGSRPVAASSRAAALTGARAAPEESPGQRRHIPGQ